MDTDRKGEMPNTGVLPAEMPLRDRVIAAMRQYEGERQHRAYTSAMRKVGAQLSYGSAPYVVMVGVSLLNDMVPTFWDEGKALLRSPLAQEFLHAQGIESFLELILRSTATKAPAEPGDAEREFRKMEDSLRKYDELITHTVSYVSTSRRDPAEVVRSPKASGEIAMRIFGSFDAYREHMRKAYQEMHTMFGKLSVVAELPLGTLLEAKLLGEGLTAEDLGINPAKLERIARAYLREIQVFGLAYTDARQRIAQREIRTYEKALAH